MKKNEILNFAGVFAVLIGGILLCTILFQQMALYVLNTGFPQLQH